MLFAEFDEAALAAECAAELEEGLGGQTDDIAVVGGSRRVGGEAPGHIELEAQLGHELAVEEDDVDVGDILHRGGQCGDDLREVRAVVEDFPKRERIILCVEVC